MADASPDCLRLPRWGRATRAGIQLHMDDQYHPVAMSETGRTDPLEMTMAPAGATDQDL